MDFESLLEYGETMGVFNILLPFLLVFAITFAVLEKLPIFKGKRHINGIVAAILGILVARNQYVVGILNRFLPNIALFMIVILMFLLLIGIFMEEHKGFQGSLLGLAVVISFIFVIWALSSDFVGEKFGLPNWLFGLDEMTKATIVFVGVFIFVIWLVIKEKPGPDASGGTKPPFGGWLEKLGGEVRK